MQMGGRASTALCASVDCCFGPPADSYGLRMAFAGVELPAWSPHLNRYWTNDIGPKITR